MSVRTSCAGSRKGFRYLANGSKTVPVWPSMMTEYLQAEGKGPGRPMLAPHIFPYLEHGQTQRIVDRGPPTRELYANSTM
jgi:hypothetical protein